ncbi:unnamed protein product [Blepharisma stoltei]|uniref:Protein kinase domain-containing protein n=1 Tax=Blepharisma stoltei TaxID=1481888 RepID=A0AAU9JY53_9CILI|nr:unnamed protein product [Blepharisma stoltei]
METFHPLDQHCFNGRPDYRFEKLIGSGSFGSVYKAYSIQNNLAVAIKRSAKSGSLVSREYKILKETASSENCVRLLDIFYSITEDGKYIQHLVFEYLPENLSRFIRNRKRAHHPLDHAEICSIFKQILQGLQFIHGKNILHRDLKPENVLIDPITMKVKLCDFGSAKIQTDKNTPFIVSRYYRAPELIFCNCKYGSEIDIWAAGCIFLELFLGSPVFLGKNEGNQFIQQANILGPPSLSDIIRLTENTQIKPKIAAKAIKIGKKQNILEFLRRSPKANEALDLIQNMLSWDPTKRPSATECLNHPFFDVC